MYNNLFINGYALRPPNTVDTKFLDLEWTDTWDGMNGTTNFYKTVLGKKRQKILTFQYLNQFEFEMLLNYINNGFWLVNYTESSFGFTGQYLIAFDGYSDTYAGGKANVKLILTPQIVES